MSLLGKTNLSKNRKFNYVPKYYDERQERLDALLNKEETGNLSDMKSRISSANMRHRSNKRGFGLQSTTKGMTLRIMLILMALIVIAYLLLGLYLPVFDSYLN